MDKTRSSSSQTTSHTLLSLFPYTTLLIIITFLCGCTYSSSLKKMNDSELNAELLRWETELNNRMAVSAVTPRASVYIAPKIPSTYHVYHNPYYGGGFGGAVNRSFAQQNPFQAALDQHQREKLVRQITDPYNVKEAQKKLNAIHNEIRRRKFSSSVPQNSSSQKRVTRDIDPSHSTEHTPRPVGGKVYHLSGSRVFHRTSCSVIQGETNLGEFSSRDKALKADAMPCKSCNP